MESFIHKLGPINFYRSGCVEKKKLRKLNYAIILLSFWLYGFHVGKKPRKFIREGLDEQKKPEHVSQIVLERV